MATTLNLAAGQDNININTLQSGLYIFNVTLENGDAARGWDQHGPYDVIVLTGSVPLLAEAFQQSLNSGGRLFAVVGEAPVMDARLITRAAPGAFSSASLFETCIPALRNAPQPARFSF